MKLSQKVGYGLASMLGVLVVTVLIGFYSTYNLSSLLNFITTSAWDTADGAMEGSIGIEAQMLAVERITAGREGDNRALLKEGEEMATEALTRMADAGLLSDQEIKNLNESIERFNDNKNTILKDYQRYTKDNAILKQTFATMQNTLNTAEEIGDGEVEELEKNPNRLISWDQGLEEKWSAADGMMEAQIHFLSVNYYFKNFVESYASSEFEEKYSQSLNELTVQLSEVSKLDIFKSTNYQNQGSISSVLNQNLTQLTQAISATSASYKEYLEALENYSNASIALLEVIEAIEESADGKVEGEASTISSTQTIAYTLCFLALVLGLAIAYFARRLFTTDVVTPIEILTHNMQAAAKNEELTLNDYDNRPDEIGDIARALDVFVEIFEENRRISKDSQRISSAVDAASTNIMMADAEFNIVYMNPAVQNMMRIAEADLKKELPKFDANNLLGQNIDVFHKNPAHQRGMLAKLSETYKTQITVGARTFALIATPIFSESKERLGTVVEWNDRTEALKHEHEKELQQQELAKVALESKRINDALDACSTNVMMADADYNIVYMNPAVQNMMRVAESDLKKELPNFNANDLIGKNIDVFHKNPAHQRSMLARLTNVYKTTIVVGARTFGLIATPIFDNQKNRLGTVVEWADKTAEVHIEKEVANLIHAANDGDLNRRLDTHGQTGFVETLSKGLNELMDNVSGFVTDVGKVFEAMAEGNLTRTITNNYRGELEKIKLNANGSVAKLTEVLTKIQSASDIVRTSSNEVAQGSDDLSRRTESQASSLEETAASMEEITATVKQTAESATQSNVLASEAKSKAEKGGTVVQGAVKAMSEIMDSSNKINDIIGVIDEIAFQTNLLALNAAVEAARAGEQGRGFAVVAGEVRTLSQRSAAAAKEIKDLIRDSVNKVESGSHMVNQSGQMLSEIVQAVDKVARMIADVNNAAVEQNSGISQINQAIAQMDEMTQQNAALVEETSAASRSMSEEANNMNRLISFFQLSKQMGSMPAASNEKIMTYQSSAPKPAASKAPVSKPSSGGNKGAASFSSDDDWEDF